MSVQGSNLSAYKQFQYQNYDQQYNQHQDQLEQKNQQYQNVRQLLSNQSQQFNNNHKYNIQNLSQCFMNTDKRQNSNLQNGSRVYCQTDRKQVLNNKLKYKKQQQNKQNIIQLMNLQKKILMSNNQLTLRKIYEQNKNKNQQQYTYSKRSFFNNFSQCSNKNTKPKILDSPQNNNNINNEHDEQQQIAISQQHNPLSSNKKQQTIQKSYTNSYKSSSQQLQQSQQGINSNESRQYMIKYEKQPSRNDQIQSQNKNSSYKNVSLRSKISHSKHSTTKFINDQLQNNLIKLGKQNQNQYPQYVAKTIIRYLSQLMLNLQVGKLNIRKSDHQMFFNLNTGLNPYNDDNLAEFDDKIYCKINLIDIVRTDQLMREYKQSEIGNSYNTQKQQIKQKQSLFDQMVQINAQMQNNKRFDKKTQSKESFNIQQIHQILKQILFFTQYNKKRLNKQNVMKITSYIYEVLKKKFQEQSVQHFHQQNSIQQEIQSNQMIQQQDDKDSDYQWSSKYITSRRQGNSPFLKKKQQDSKQIAYKKKQNQQKIQQFYQINKRQINQIIQVLSIYQFILSQIVAKVNQSQINKVKNQKLSNKTLQSLKNRTQNHIKFQTKIFNKLQYLLSCDQIENLNSKFRFFIKELEMSEEKTHQMTKLYNEQLVNHIEPNDNSQGYECFILNFYELCMNKQQQILFLVYLLILVDFYIKLTFKQGHLIQDLEQKQQKPFKNALKSNNQYQGHQYNDHKSKVDQSKLSNRLFPIDSSQKQNNSSISKKSSDFNKLSKQKSQFHHSKCNKNYQQNPRIIKQPLKTIRNKNYHNLITNRYQQKTIQKSFNFQKQNNSNQVNCRQNIQQPSITSNDSRVSKPNSKQTKLLPKKQNTSKQYVNTQTNSIQQKLKQNKELKLIQYKKLMQNTPSSTIKSSKSMFTFNKLNKNPKMHQQKLQKLVLKQNLKQKSLQLQKRQLIIKKLIINQEINQIQQQLQTKNLQLIFENKIIDLTSRYKERIMTNNELLNKFKQQLEIKDVYTNKIQQQRQLQCRLLEENNQLHMIKRWKMKQHQKQNMNKKHTSLINLQKGCYKQLKYAFRKKLQ